MSRRFKSAIAGPSFPRTLGPAGEARIAAGEPWLRVWSQQLAMPLTAIAHKATLDVARLLEIEFGAEPTDDELQGIAKALKTEVELIAESRNVQSL
jgi:hypothetical protein